MRKVFPSSRFDRDLKRMVKRGKSLRKLGVVVRKLQVGEELQKRHRPHSLSGRWADYFECHIEPDWLLIYQLNEDEVRLVRTGTHVDLF